MSTTTNETKDIATAATRIAILIPCHNEEPTVSEVVIAFHAELPTARIYVFDNNSTDRTVERALAAGASVRRESRQGKGFVVQSMFRGVDADVYVMVDGDGTYPAESVHQLIAPVLEGEADMVVGSRLHSGIQSEFRQLNRWGNRLVLALLNSIFKVKLTDILSGYRAFNRNFVKGLPLFGGGFEIETELTIKAVARGFRIVEIPTALTARPEGSHSKIKFFRDGFIILNTILALFRDYKPLTFFGSVGLFLVLLAMVPGVLVAIQFLGTGTVTHLSWALLAVGLGLGGMLLLVAGLILHTIVRRFQEIEHTLQVRADDLHNAKSVHAERQDAR
jgi:glycosyltransferase involved in cell wall biosynthesis